MAHETDSVLPILVRVEPVDLLTFLDDTPHCSELDIALGAEEETVTGSRLLLELSQELPVLLTKPLLASKSIGVSKPVQEELVIKMIAAVVGSPDLVAIFGQNMSIHADQEQVIRAKDVGPALEMR